MAARGIIPSMNNLNLGESSSKQKSHPPKNLKTVFFDVQSTGFGPSHEVIQLAATSGNRKFSAYIMPKDQDAITEEVSELTGLFIIRNQMRDQYNNCEPVNALTKKEAVKNFIEFLKSFGQKILLVGFNCFPFDGPMLSALISEVGMTEDFKKVVHGFSDALSIMKKKLKERNETKHGFKLKKLAEDFLGKKHEGSNSIFHVDWLQRLVQHPRINISDTEFIGISKNAGKIINDTEEHQRKAHLRKDLEVLTVTVNERGQFIGLDDRIIDKFVEEDMGLEHIYWHWKHGGREYVEMMMIKDVITSDRRMIKRILDNFAVVFKDGLLSILSAASVVRGGEPFVFKKINL